MSDQVLQAHVQEEEEDQRNSEESDPVPQNILDLPSGVDESTLKEVADNLETDEQIEDLARALRVSRPEINRCHMTNRLTGAMTTRGTVELLINWRSRVRPEDQWGVLKSAMTSAKLLHLRDTVLKKAESRQQELQKKYASQEQPLPCQLQIHQQLDQDQGNPPQSLQQQSQMGGHMLQPPTHQYWRNSFPPPSNSTTSYNNLDRSNSHGPLHSFEAPSGLPLPSPPGQIHLQHTTDSFEAPPGLPLPSPPGQISLQHTTGAGGQGAGFGDISVVVNALQLMTLNQQQPHFPYGPLSSHPSFPNPWSYSYPYPVGLPPNQLSSQSAQANMHYLSSLQPQKVIIPHEVKNELGLLLNTESLVFNNWEKLACELGLDGYITIIKARCPHRFTEGVLQLAEMQRKIKSLEELRVVLTKMDRDDCIEVIDDYLLKRADREAVPATHEAELLSLPDFEGDSLKVDQ